MFVSPTHGQLTLEQVFEKIKEFIMADPERDYYVGIGSDSQRHKKYVTFVTTIMVHRIGHGAIYFYDRESQYMPYEVFKQRITSEVTDSVTIAQRFKDEVVSTLDKPVQFKIDIDVSKRGKTSVLIKELVGYVESCGFEANIKDHTRMHDKNYIYPTAASCVADRYSK